MEDRSILLQSVIAIAFPIALWLFARAALIPLIERQYKWLGARRVKKQGGKVENIYLIRHSDIVLLTRTAAFGNRYEEILWET
jgi:hypothetical protein